MQDLHLTWFPELFNISKKNVEKTMRLETDQSILILLVITLSFIKSMYVSSVSYMSCTYSVHNLNFACKLPCHSGYAIPAKSMSAVTLDRVPQDPIAGVAQNLDIKAIFKYFCGIPSNW